VAAGSYSAQTIGYDASKAGATSRVVFRCAPGFASVFGSGTSGVSLIGAQHLEFVGCDLRGDLGATAQDRSNPASPKPSDFVIRDGRMQSFHLAGAQHVTLQGNDIGHYSYDDGFGSNSLYSDNGQPTETDVKVLDNVFRGITISVPSHDECLFVKRVDGLVIARNEFLGCPGIALAFYDAQVDPALGYAHASNILVENNFLQCRPLNSCYGGSLAMQADTKGTETFRNFTFRFNSTDQSIAFGGCSASLCQNVVAYGNATGGTLSCQMSQSYNLGSSCGGTNNPTDPTFVDANAGDYHAAPGSAQLGFVPAGFCAGSACPPGDVDGDPRAAGVPLDAGADER
jgi:hypothetical protein